MNGPVLVFRNRRPRRSRKTTTPPPPSARMDTVPLANKLQWLALANPAALYDIEKLVNCYYADLLPGNGREGA